MRVSSSAAVRSNAGYDARSVEPSSAGSGTLQWTSSGRDGNSGQTSRTRSHSVITVSNRWERNSSRCLVRRRADVDPVRAKDADGVGMQRLRMAAGADRLDRPGRHALEQRFCDLGPRAVARAQEQHPRSATRAPSSWTRRRRGLRGAARGAAHRLRSAEPRGRRRGRWRSSCRGGPPSCGARSRAHLRGADAGGTTPSSAARRPASSTPARSDRSARALATTATAAGATPAARTAAGRPERSPDETIGRMPRQYRNSANQIKSD